MNGGWRVELWGMACFLVMACLAAAATNRAQKSIYIYDKLSMVELMATESHRLAISDAIERGRSITISVRGSTITSVSPAK